jgi:signal transduction histidine kinase
MEMRDGPPLDHALENGSLETLDVNEVFDGGGEMGALMRTIDWSRTPLGPIHGWSQALRTTVGLLLRNRFPMLLWWGPEFVQFYNDAYRPIPGAKHPRAMGQTASECWAEIWHIIRPMIEAPFSGRPATWSDDLFLLINRKGFLEETHFTVSYSPVPDQTARPTGVGGVLATVAETTEQVYGERQLRTLRELGARAAEAKTPQQACETAARTFAENSFDVPFALLYLVDADAKQAHLAASCGFAADDGPANPSVIDLRSPSASAWPVLEIAETRAVEVLRDLSKRFAALPGGNWSEPAHSAVCLPLASPDQPKPYGVLISGISPHRALDDGYRTFFELAAAQVITAIRNANAFEEQRQRAEQLAEIDRAKTLFFSNVSHEFRTPLTLMLGPLEDALGAPGRALSGDNLETTYRNALRLLKLVNALLDFSRIEAGRVQASFEPTALSRLTADLASVFASAFERASVELLVRCEELTESVYVDREMWEKIVLNLISNAFKFTFEGEVEVALRASGDGVELVVRDTGVGIARDELPRLFERFHRIEGVRARTHEGSGIGLALVQELVRMHGGRIDVDSELGKGTTFKVHVPFGTAHLPADRIAAERTLASTATRAAAFLEETLRWVPSEAERSPPSDSAPPAEQTARARILLADDNADMREYVSRLLRERWQIETVGDGLAALAAARRERFDLVVTDVMMPGLDGFGLLRELKKDPATRSIPVIMLSARAGEESRIDGLEAGADDYVTKPFSARELIARITTQLEVRKLEVQTREQLEALAADAAAANRAKDEFVAMLGHELRNPLSPILTALQLMKLRGAHSREQEIIERQVGHLTRLVDDLLDLSRITQGKVELRRQRIELAEVVVRALETASPLLEQRRHALVLELEREGLAVNVDPDRMAQVIANLLTNAAKYSDPGSKISVRGELQGDWIRCCVKDEGIGISDQMIERVFDMFVQQPQSLDRARGGLGLGLSIVRSLVKMHGGTVAAKSEGLGRGSEFVVEIPAAGPIAVVPTPLPPLTLAQRRLANPRSARILVVDDNGDAAATLAEALAQLGYVVKVAFDGPSALALAQSFDPHVALVDIGLPVMDGYEVAERLRELLAPARKLDLIAVTGYGQDADRRRSAEAGFRHHLVKPPDLQELERVVEELYDESNRGSDAGASG